MNCSKPMKVNTKRLIIALLVALGIGICLGVGITFLTINTSPAIAEAPINESTKNFTEEVQEVEPTAPTIPPEETKTELTQPPEPELLGEWRITAYCACRECCGEWADNRPNGIVYGAAGIELQAGVSVASPLPLGTIVKVEGLGEYIVQDRTAKWVAEKYSGEVIDIYFSNHEEACEFGLQYRNVYIVKGVESDD